MRTFLDLFIIWPLKIVLFIVAIGFILFMGFILLAKLSAMGKDIKTIKAKLF